MKKWAKLIFTLATLGVVSLASNTTDVQAGGKSSSKPIVIYLSRHGETTANVMHLAQGWSDFPLTQNGIKGAEYLGTGLKGTDFKSAYAGSLTRQEQTARGVLDASGNKKVKVNVDPRLREGNFGSYEGRPDKEKNIPEVMEFYGYSDPDKFVKDFGKEFPNKYQDGYYELDKANKLDTKLSKKDRAESSKQVQKRMTKAMDTIVKQNKNGGNVLVVSSGMSIDQLLYALKIPQYKGESLENNSVTKVVYKDGKYKLDGKIGSVKEVEKGKEKLEK